MILGGLTTDIQLSNSKEFYTNGDLISGFLILSSPKSFSVRNIEIKLRCDELAYVWVPNGQGGYYEAETVRHLSIKRTVFPSKSVMSQSDKEQRFTIKSGVHKFEFGFQIPLGHNFPQTVHIDNSTSGIRWYLKGVVHRGQVLSSTKRIVREFEMRPSIPLTYDGSSIKTESVTNTMHAYLPGYAAQLKTAAGRLKGLFPSNSQFRKRIEVSMLMGIPIDGVLQAPSSLPVQIDISSQSEELLLVKKFELVIKAKYVVRVNEGWNSSVHRESHNLVILKDLDLPLKRALELIQDKIFASQITKRLPGSFSNKHFDLSYKLVSIALMASRENPNAVEKLRVSMPITLHHTNVGPSNEAVQNGWLMIEDYDDLPMYCEMPQSGEMTFTNP